MDDDTFEAMQDGDAAGRYAMALWTEFLVAQIGAGAIDKPAAFRLLDAAAERCRGPTSGEVDDGVLTWRDQLRAQIDAECPDWTD